MEARTISYHQHLVIGVTTFVEIIGITAYALRLLARRLSAATLWYDDYLMGVGLITASIPGICNYAGLRYGLGKHLTQISEHDRQSFLICFYVLQLGYVSTLPVVKIAVLLFYHRIFPQQRFQYALYAMGTFLTLFLFSNWLAVALQCLPIHSFWQPEVPHHCFDQVTYYIAQGSLNFVSDVFVVVMPIPILWNLHLPTPRRVALVIVFLLGGFACAVSLCRIISLDKVDPADITWTNVGPGLWSAAEAEVLVLSANLPLMSPIVQRLRGKLHSIRERTQKDEESSNILELSAIESGKKLIDSQDEASAASARLHESTNATTVAVTAEGMARNGRDRSGSVMPHDRIVVETGLEQQFTEL